jgi:hypothetical protein
MSTKRLATLPTAAFAAFAALAIAAAGARAGTYVINDCPSPPASASDSGAWTVFGGPRPTKAPAAEEPAIGSALGGSMGPAALGAPGRNQTAPRSQERAWTREAPGARATRRGTRTA